MDINISREGVKHWCAILAILLSVVLAAGAADYRMTLESKAAEPADSGVAGSVACSSAGDQGATNDGSAGGSAADSSGSDCAGDGADTVATTGAS